MRSGGAGPYSSDSVAIATIGGQAFAVVRGLPGPRDTCDLGARSSYVTLTLAGAGNKDVGPVPYAGMFFVPTALGPSNRPADAPIHLVSRVDFAPAGQGPGCAHIVEKFLLCFGPDGTVKRARTSKCE